MTGRFVLDQDTAGRYRFVLVTETGETVAIGEGYTTKAAALLSIDQVRRNAPVSRVEDRTGHDDDAPANGRRPGADPSTARGRLSPRLGMPR